MTLEILICSINDGIGGVEKMLLARQEGLRYVVSWQQTDGVAREVPKALCRDDVRVVTMAVVMEMMVVMVRVQRVWLKLSHRKQEMQLKQQ